LYSRKPVEEKVVVIHRGRCNNKVYYLNKLDLIPDRIEARLVGVFRNGGGLGTDESYISLVFFDPLLHRSPCFPDVDFAALTGNPVDI